MTVAPPLTEFDHGYRTASVHALIWSNHLGEDEYRELVCALAIGAIDADRPLEESVADRAGLWNDDELWTALRAAYDACPTTPQATL